MPKSLTQFPRSLPRPLIATSHGKHTTDTSGQQPPGCPPRLTAVWNSPKYAVPLPLMPCPRQSSAANNRPSLAIHGDNCSAAACNRLKSRQPACRAFPRRKASSSGSKGRGELAGRQTPYTAAVASPSGGRTTTKFITPTLPDGSIRSPRPRQMAGPRWRKNGTSLPSSAAIAAKSFGDRPSFQPRFAATRAAAASLEPPPKPAAVGIRLISRSRAPCRPPVRRRTRSTARKTRFLPSRGTPAKPLLSPASGRPAAAPHWHSNSKSSLDVV